jgi:prepilin-type N-terminal cleavage/methylation domain-containing protein
MDPLPLRARGSGQDGFTLIEIMLACAVITLGLVATSYGLNTGIQGVETGRQQSTAMFLAEQRMDEVKAAALRATEPPLALVTTANFPPDAYGAITAAPRYRRTVTLTPYTGPAGGLPTGMQGIRVDVDVFYLQVTASGTSSAERSVRLSTFLTSR